jgi:superfamily II DNA/RNA helicase
VNRPILVVGTPGRLAELSMGGQLHMHGCGVLVLDEADQLLAPCFRKEMVRITEHAGARCPWAPRGGFRV